jgi:hypothetical protein
MPAIVPPKSSRSEIPTTELEAAANRQLQIIPAKIAAEQVLKL